MLLNIALIVAGLVVLVAGGEALVRGASCLAHRAGISPLVVGLTVVSIATSAPELAVTIGSVFSGEPDLAVGNVVGSNIANLLLVVGIGALIAPLVVQRQLVRIDLPVMAGFAVLLFLFALDGEVSVLEGGLLLLLFVINLAFSVWQSRRSPDSVAVDTEHEYSLSMGRAIAFVVIGVAALVIGAQLLVAGAVGIATALGVSGLIVGLTIVAVGTSLPEMAATIVAVRRGEVDIAVGNVVGSNIANIGLVLGLPALIGGGITVPLSAEKLDIPLMLGATTVFAILAFTGMKIVRWEGALFLLLYAAYITYSVLASSQSEALFEFTEILTYLLMPLVVILLVAVLVRELRRRRRILNAE